MKIISRCLIKYNSNGNDNNLKDKDRECEK